MKNRLKNSSNALRPSTWKGNILRARISHERRTHGRRRAWALARKEAVPLVVLLVSGWIGAFAMGVFADREVPVLKITLNQRCTAFSRANAELIGTQIPVIAPDELSKQDFDKLSMGDPSDDPVSEDDLFDANKPDQLAFPGPFAIFETFGGPDPMQSDPEPSSCWENTFRVKGVPHLRMVADVDYTYTGYTGEDRKTAWTRHEVWSESAESPHEDPGYWDRYLEYETSLWQERVKNLVLEDAQKRGDRSAGRMQVDPAKIYADTYRTALHWDPPGWFTFSKKSMYINLFVTQEVTYPAYPRDVFDARDAIRVTERWSAYPPPQGQPIDIVLPRGSELDAETTPQPSQIFRSEDSNLPIYRFFISPINVNRPGSPYQAIGPSALKLTYTFPARDRLKDWLIFASAAVIGIAIQLVIDTYRQWQRA